MIKSLTLQGFKSYRQRQTIRFTPGVNKISGRNASGKTSILEAILFGLFGEVPNVDKKDLVTLGGGSLRVEVEFRSPLTNQRARVIREGGLTREGVFRSTLSYLEIEGEDKPYAREVDIQSKVRDLLGLGKRAFFNVVYCKQKEFVEIINPPQKIRMDAILGLTTPSEIKEQLREVKAILLAKGRIDEKPVFEERMKTARDRIIEGESKLEDARRRQLELEKDVESLKSQLSQVKDRRILFESLLDEFKALERASQSLEVKRGILLKTEEELAESEAEMGEPKGLINELEDKLRRVGEHESHLEKAIEERSEERMVLDAEASRLKHQIGEHSELEKSGLTICPKCGQKIDYALLKEDLEVWRRQLEEKTRLVQAVERSVNELKTQRENAVKERSRLERQLDLVKERMRRLEDLRRDIDAMRREEYQLSKRIQTKNMEIIHKIEEALGTQMLETEAQRLVERQHKATIEEYSQLQRRLGEAESQLREAKLRIEEIEKILRDQRRILEESETALSRIREYEAKINTVVKMEEWYTEYAQKLRDSTLRQLEWLTGKYFEKLTDQQIYAGFHIDRESYSLEVQPLGVNSLMPAWRAGGGHESLFALSERLALLRVMGFPNLLILDEPTDAVDSENIPQLLEYISKSSREIRQIILVTHHGYGEEEVANMIRVGRIDGESKVTQELKSYV
ncbi:AAA family ATPase [Candidatus Bathyarchaeota archaeon]|nr:AAA family ATPase [Candidatus Bathyarchaeota archaeon]MBS7630978.1 AAA family ATPase [Candidatus Bathyarchaeota archaeon]